MVNKNNYFAIAAIALIYIAFFGVIGAAIYITKSATPLWALLLTPSIKIKTND